ncbi:MAG: NigD-like N-terminal domain-containing protein [Verrucomicrobia bacterium]|nr:NigD-like N-terminal domain-containing protein [Prolixibacteraceae bacterium]
MKKLIFYLMFGITFGFLSSCELLDEDENSMNNAWVGFGLVHKDSGNNSFTIELDNGEVLFPANSTGWNDDVTDNQRVLANFTVINEKENTENVEQYDVRINSLRNILYKGILDITPAIEDSIGNDPIHVKDHWQKKNMLNFELQYRGGNKMHYINLVKQPNATATEPVVLELRHNDNDDPDLIRMSAVVTFDLSSIKIAGKDSVTYKVISKGFNNEGFEFTGVYKY